MNIRTGFAAGFLVLLAACGGGGGGSSDPQPVTNQPVVQKAVVIDAEGDSTMWGLQIINGVRGRAATPVPAALQKALQASLNPNATVTNNGVSGANLYDLKTGYAYAQPFATRLAATHFDIVIENFAINDSVTETMSDYQNYLIDFVTIVRSMGGTPVLEEPNPVCNPQYTNLDSYVAALRQVAQQQGVTLIAQYDYIKSLPNWQGMLTDCTHPSDALYAIKAQREYAVIGPIVAAMK